MVLKSLKNMKKNWFWSGNKRNHLYITCNYYFLLNAWFLFILMSIHDARSSFTSPLNSFVSFFPQSSTWDADLIKEALHPNHQLITIPSNMTKLTRNKCLSKYRSLTVWLHYKPHRNVFIFLKISRLSPF